LARRQIRTRCAVSPGTPGIDIARRFPEFRGRTDVCSAEIRTLNRDHHTHDVVFLADMARDGDQGFRIRREVECLAAKGYRVALRHLSSGGAATIMPDIQHCLRHGIAEALAPEAGVHARLAIVVSPALVKTPSGGLGTFRADRVVLVVDRPPDAGQMGHWFSFAIGPMSFAPTNRWVRGRLAELGYPVAVEAEDWRAIAAPVPPRPAEAPGRLRPVTGRVSASGGAQWPGTAAELDTVHPPGGPFDTWMLGAPPKDLRKESAAAEGWTILAAHDITVERFVAALDAFVYFPGAEAPELPEAAIAAAMATDRVVVLPPRLRPHFGPGALYAEPEEAVAALAALLADADALDAHRRTARDWCGYLWSEAAYLDRIRGLIGPPAVPAPRRHARTGRRRALFVPSNGIGIGHATRLLAIARRLEDTVEPVFASLGQASRLIESFGYAAEYLPSHSDIGAALARWDAWFHYEFAEIIERQGPDVVVFDGNNPTPGLVHAALAHGDCRLVWVRRGMNPATPSPYLGNARFFDCIIEPGEVAGALDKGSTAGLRHEVVQVPPIRLLEEHELLGRDEARAALGLAAEGQAVLIQPGSGGNRDVVDLTDRIVTTLARFEGVQVVVAEWSNGAIPLPRWPGVRILRGFPISRYFNAFDFSVAAAGYNTYHEVLAFGLPSIFVANRHPSMDDQGARAEFAQERMAGFDLTDDEMHLLPTLCRALLTPATNAVLRQNCAALRTDNGAEAAAEIVKRLAGAA
jgi:UDP:flavonoid glycosyltransferase YjiC (YdhE family)